MRSRRRASSHAGDFGRPKPSLLEGLIPQQFWKGPVTGYSSYPLTDPEEELRDRSYALIRPNEPRGNWNIYIAGFQIAHLLPPSFTYSDHTEYTRMLLWTPARSEASSYNRLIEDMDGDGRLTSPLSRSPARSPISFQARAQPRLCERAVGRRDRQRLWRIRENRMVTAWVHHRRRRRVASYRYALERLVIAVPSPRGRGGAGADALAGDRASGRSALRAARARNSPSRPRPLITK